jgi:hypothetical protein
MTAFVRHLSDYIYIHLQDPPPPNPPMMDAFAWNCQCLIASHSNEMVS